MILLVIFFMFLWDTTDAHPGRTASDGCHYCRTNCDKWGEVYGARHCHSGSIPTRRPTFIPTPTPTPTPAPAWKSEVRSLSDPRQDNGGETLGIIGLTIFMGWAGYKLLSE